MAILEGIRGLSRPEAGRREMRKQMLGTITALLAIVAMAQAQTPGAEASRAALEKVSVVRAATGIQVEMTTKGTVTPKVETLSSPARLVVDLPNTVLATSVKRIAVGNSGVTGVRVGTDASATTRVVVDLERQCKYELVPGAGDKLTLKIDSGAVAARAGPAETKVSAPVTTAAITPAEQKPPKGTAQDFVVVEPSYTAKQDTPVDPSVRAAGAASKFVERPEGNLLPPPSAAMQQTASSGSAQGSSPAVEPAVNMAAEQKTHSPQPTSGPKYTGEPISVNL